MRSRSLAGGFLVAAALLLIPASAQGINTTQGADLSKPSDAGFGCETQFLPGDPGNNFTYQPSPPEFDGIVDDSSCTMFTFWGGVTDRLLAASTGTVTKVRVKSGANPAPLRAVILRYRYTTNPNNPSQVTDRQCCTAEQQGPVFQPTPNAVSESVVNLPTQVVKPQGNLSGWGDFVGVNAVGPGTVPLNSTGPHTSFPTNVPSVQFAYPSLQPGGRAGNDFGYPNYQPLIQFDWTDGGCAAAARAKARSSCSKNPKAPFSMRGKSLKLKKGKAKLGVKCTAPAGQRCRGTVSLRTRAKKPKSLASKKVNVKGGKKATVTLKLSRKARRMVRKKSNKVQALANLGAAGTASKNMTLKR